MSLEQRKREQQEDRENIYICLIWLVLWWGLYSISKNAIIEYRQYKREQRRIERIEQNKRNAIDTDEKIVARL